MRVSGSKNDLSAPAAACPVHHVHKQSGLPDASGSRGLTCRQQVRRQGMPVSRAFVSGVSPVSAILRTTRRRRRIRGARARMRAEELLAPHPAVLGQVRLVQWSWSFVVRRQGRDTGGTTETRAIACLVADEALAAPYHRHIIAPAHSSSSTSPSARTCLVSRTCSSTAPQNHQIFQLAHVRYSDG